MCVFHREDGRSFCARKEPDDSVAFALGEPQEPFVSVRNVVRMLYGHYTERCNLHAGMARHQVKEAIRKALDRQEYETANADRNGRTEVVLSAAGVVRLAVARDGLDCRDPHQQESVLTEADKILDRLATTD
jgi:hypothetical protein